LAWRSPVSLDPEPLRSDKIVMTIAAYGLIDDADIELDMAALALSELDHPGINVSPYLELLQTIVGGLRAVGAGADTPQEQAETLAGVLHGEFAFNGDLATYDALFNGDFIRVLDRRRGLPVSLSILYVAAARRLGWTADALDTPGHVFVRVGADAPVLIDPFNKGALVSHAQMALFLRRTADGGAPLSAENCGPMSNRTMLVRLLINQASRAERAGDPGRASILYQRMTLVAPDNPDGWWSLARLQLASGMVDEARHSLSAMLEVTRDLQRRDLVTAALEAIAQR
jgi:regulator of sirC expression with transglutaminase-like and TPR domain